MTRRSLADFSKSSARPRRSELAQRSRRQSGAVLNLMMRMVGTITRDLPIENRLGNEALTVHHRD